MMSKKIKQMTEEEQVYEELRQAWDGQPLWAPRSPAAMKLFKYFFPTREDAEIGKYVECRMVGGRSKTAVQIAEECGKDVERVKEVLEGLERRGCILSQEKKGEPGVRKYINLGIWGMMNFLGTLGKDDAEGIVYRELVNRYNDEVGLMEWGSSKYPAMRTLVVDQNIDAQAKVLPYELAGEIIKANQKIAIAYCGCRVKYRNCNHRIDTCIYFGSAADTKVEHSKVVPGARPVNYVSQEEALKRVEECLREGLVPTTFNNSDPTQAMALCMCCSCCCHQLKGYATNITGWGNPYQLMKSNFQPKVDREKCHLCLKCVKLCPVKALWHHWPHKPDLSDDFIFLEEERCIGCGVCAFNCPNQAVTMVRVRELTLEPDIISQFERMHREARH